jgi:hypothetical protein
MSRIRERILIRIAWALPSGLVYWAAIRLIAHATQGQHERTVVPELTAMDALRRWGER